MAHTRGDLSWLTNDRWLLFLVDQFDGREWNVAYHTLPQWLRAVLEKPSFKYRDRFIIILFLVANGVNPYHWLEAFRARVNVDGYAHALSLLGDLGISRNAYGNWIPSFVTKPGNLRYKVFIVPPRRLKPRYAEDTRQELAYLTLQQLGYTAAV